MRWPGCCLGACGAGAGGAGPRVPGDRGGVGGSGGHGAGPAAPVPLAGGAGARELSTRLAGVLALDPVQLDPAGSVLADAVVAVAAAAAAARGRWPGMITVSGWELAAVLTLGSLLSPVVRFARVRDGLPASALA
jgi:hypothetical protein